MSVALIVMVAVLSSYTYLGRHLAQLVYQQTLESEARRTLLTFEQDVRSAISLSNPSASSVTFTIPSSGGTADVSYTYYSSATTVSGVAVPAQSLVRQVTAPAAGTPLILLRNLVSQASLTFGSSPYTYGFKYYDATGTAYAAPISSSNLIGIKQVSLSFLTAAGSSSTGTATPNYYGTSPRLALRNKTLLQ